jgi:hypothetical protein
MQLISTLCAGVYGAANGHAELYIRDTATRATWYSDFEASTSNSSGANITLDAYGAVEVYVNQLVDVVVKDADGATVRSFTDGYAAPNVEVISPSFTGTDYVTAASAVSEPTTLQAVLNLWETNNGAPDWKVLFNGVATTIENAIGPLVGLVFNVKSPVYGATGDGVTSDQTAVAAALAAAVAAGGGVLYFPPGTYRLTAALSWDNRVSILGVGGGQSVITMDAAATAINFASPGTAQNPSVFFTGVTFSALQATGANPVIAIGAATKLSITRCTFGTNSNTTNTYINVTAGASSSLTIQECYFSIQGASQRALNIDNTVTGSTLVRFIGNTIEVAAATTTYSTSMVRMADIGVRGYIQGNRFMASVVTSGTYSAIELVDGLHVVTGNDFNPSASPSFDATLELTSNALGLYLYERDNFFSQTNTNRYDLTGTLRQDSFVDMQAIETLVSTSPCTLTNIHARAIHVTCPDGASPTIPLPQILYPGQTLDLTIENSNAGTQTGTFTFTHANSPKWLMTFGGLGSTQFGSIRWVASDSVTSPVWVQVGAVVEDI